MKEFERWMERDEEERMKERKKRREKKRKSNVLRVDGLFAVGMTTSEVPHSSCVTVQRR